MATFPTLSVAMRMATKIRNQMAGGFVRTLPRLKNCVRREFHVPDHRLAQAALSAYSQVYTAMAQIWLLWHSLTGCLCCLSLGFNAILAQLPHAPIGKGSILKAL